MRQASASLVEFVAIAFEKRPDRASGASVRRTGRGQQALDHLAQASGSICRKASVPPGAAGDKIEVTRRRRGSRLGQEQGQPSSSSLGQNEGIDGSFTQEPLRTGAGPAAPAPSGPVVFSSLRKNLGRAGLVRAQARMVRQSRTLIPHGRIPAEIIKPYHNRTADFPRESRVAKTYSPIYNAGCTLFFGKECG